MWIGRITGGIWKASTCEGDVRHWYLLTRHLGTTHSFVNRVWQAHGLKPYLIRVFKLSNDPRFEEKLRDVVRNCVGLWRFKRR